MPLSITSPDLELLVDRMSAADPTEAYRRAANQIALEHVEPHIGRAAVAAGASNEMLGDFGTYTGADGEVYVGVPSRSPAHDEAHRLEYGTLSRPPGDYVAGTVAARQRAFNRSFEDALTRHLRDVV